jgi:hypothetical protein
MTKRILYHYHGRGFSLSFRQRSFFSTRNLFVIPTEKFFSSTRNPVVIPTEKLFLLRRGISLSFRQRSFYFDEESFVIPIEKFLLRRGISLSFQMRSSCFDEESLCHSDREAVFASTRNLFVIPTEKFFCFDEESFIPTSNLYALDRIDSSVAK